MRPEACRSKSKHFKHSSFHSIIHSFPPLHPAQPLSSQAYPSPDPPSRPSPFRQLLRRLLFFLTTSLAFPPFPTPLPLPFSIPTTASCWLLRRLLPPFPSLSFPSLFLFVLSGIILFLVFFWILLYCFCFFSVFFCSLFSPCICMQGVGGCVCDVFCRFEGCRIVASTLSSASSWSILAVFVFLCRLGGGVLLLVLSGVEVFC